MEIIKKQQNDKFAIKIIIAICYGLVKDKKYLYYTYLVGRGLDVNQVFARYRLLDLSRAALAILLCVYFS